MAQKANRGQNPQSVKSDGAKTYSDATFSSSSGFHSTPEKIQSRRDYIKHLQRTVGNQAVERLWKSGWLQRKLHISPANDKYEQEADAVAEKVVSMDDVGNTPEPDTKSGSAERVGNSPPVKTRQISRKSVAESITPLQRTTEKPEEQLQEKESEEEQLRGDSLQKSSAPGEEDDEGQAKLQRVEEDDESQRTLDARKKELQSKGLIPLEIPGGCKIPTGVNQAYIQRRRAEQIPPKIPGDCKIPTGVNQAYIQKRREERTPPPNNFNESGSAAPPGVESSINSAKGGGKPMSEGERSYYEPRFGSDFSGVRIHTGGQANDLSKSVNAKAFTVGKNIFFGSGQYNPDTSDGKKLMAHELTHTLQQRGQQDGAAKRETKEDTITNKIPSSSSHALQRTPREFFKMLPDVTLHVVKKGDTLWDLSKKYYGDATKFEYIYYANRDKIQNVEKLQIGSRLDIPYPETLKNAKIPATDTFYVNHFKFLIKAKAFAIIEKQKKYIKKLAKQYADKKNFKLLETLLKIKKVDDDLAKKESSLEWDLFINAMFSGGVGGHAHSDIAQMQSIKDKIDVIKSLRLQLLTAYPALETIRGEKLANSNEKIKEQINAGFQKIHSDLNTAEEVVLSGDINLNKLGPIINAILKKENITKEKAKTGDQKSKAIYDWLDDQEFEEKLISIGGFVLSLGLLIASGLSGGTLAPICLSVASAVVATGTSAYDLEIAHDVYHVAKAGKGKLTGVEDAKFNFIMGVITLALDAIALGKVAKVTLVTKSVKLQKIVTASEKVGKEFFNKAKKAEVFTKILNLPDKEFNLAMDILKKRNLQWIQEHHWINEVLGDHLLWKQFNIDIQGAWNKNFLVGHAGYHSDVYFIENRRFLNILYSQADNLTREQVITKLKGRTEKLLKTTKSKPTSLYQNPDKPVIVLE